VAVFWIALQTASPEQPKLGAAVVSQLVTGAAAWDEIPPKRITQTARTAESRYLDFMFASFPFREKFLFFTFYYIKRRANLPNTPGHRSNR
jgi:hypothetical protein